MHIGEDSIDISCRPIGGRGLGMSGGGGGVGEGWGGGLGVGKRGVVTNVRSNEAWKAYRTYGFHQITVIAVDDVARICRQQSLLHTSATHPATIQRYAGHFPAYHISQGISARLRFN